MPVIEIAPSISKRIVFIVNPAEIRRDAGIKPSTKFLVFNEGGNILLGGERLNGEKYKNGFYLAPTLIDKVDPQAEISQSELFGPIACLYKSKDYKEALDIANNSPFGLTGCIHTANFDRANHFIQNLQAGVAVVNAGTFGSEPHMPFGGIKQSGNGTREPGTEAIDIYSELKDVYINISPEVN